LSKVYLSLEILLRCSYHRMNMATEIDLLSMTTTVAKLMINCISPIYCV